MTERDVVIQAFSDIGGAKLAATFAEPPVVLSVGGSNSSTFAQAARDVKRDLATWLARQPGMKGITARRVALVSFSAGWAWSTEIMNGPSRDRVDTALVLDGIHTEALDGWHAYARLAAVGGDAAPRLWMVHTSIKPPFVSTTVTNTRIAQGAWNWKEKEGIASVSQVVPEYITRPPALAKPMPIYSSVTKNTKTFTVHPVKEFEGVGNVWRCAYHGETPQDHIFNAQVVQLLYWDWLREVWANPEVGVRFTPRPLDAA